MNSSIRSFVLGAALAGVLAGVLVGTVRISGWLSDRVLLHAAESDAQHWGTRIVAPAAQALASPGPHLHDDERLRADARRAGVISYRVIDPEGGVRLVSREAQAAAPVSLPAVRRVMAESRALVEAVAGAADGPGLAVRVLMPLFREGRPVAVAEVTLDQTERRGTVQAVIGIAAAGLLALAALGFGIPLFAFLHRNRQKEAADQRIHYLARHDALTGLVNRAQFQERLDGVIGAAGEPGVAVLYIDLERVQTVNDLFGHAVGDEVITQVAAELVALAGEGALVARLGGDEFAVSPLRPADPARTLDLARAILEGIARPRRVAGQEVAIAASIGVAAVPDDGPDAAALLKSAHLALSHAKARGGAGVVAFERRMDEDLQRRRDLERRVRDAAATDSFDLHFQPVFRVASGELTGFEALLRLPADQGGFVSPALFVPVAEELGLISGIGAWVLRRACAFAASWPGELAIAVNLSPAQFKDGEVVRAVRAALAESGLAPGRLELEITEGLLMSDAEAIMRELRELKGLGVSIVMDDFGTGYSSLSYLWKFPFDRIKIDRSFMRGLDQADSRVADILHAIMSLARSLRLRVTAEGIETEAQAEVLRRLGCDEAQGFLLGRPMPATDVAAVIAREVRRLVEPAPGLRAVG